MNTAYIVKGSIINHDTIKLNEPVPIEDGSIRIIIEKNEPEPLKKREAGLWKGRIVLAADFDEPLKDFSEYM
jgi:hypothetical protein